MEPLLPLLPCSSSNDEEFPPGTPSRPSCERCGKVESLCICSRFKGVVQNKTRILILQHPRERNHTVASARIALLGLRNVRLVAVPEARVPLSSRNRPRVPGSRKSLMDMGAFRTAVTVRKEEPVITVEKRTQNSVHVAADNNRVCEQPCSSRPFFCDNSRVCEEPCSIRYGTPEDERRHEIDGRVCDLETIVGSFLSVEDKQTAERLLPSRVESFYKDHQIAFNADLLRKVTLRTAVGLLFPSESALDLASLPVPCLSDLIVLDGTWSKAKRIFFENPWLQALPHYKLPGMASSLYEGIRKQPKPGCMSTIESIIYALKILEPETEGLDDLLVVFSSMIDDLKRCKKRNEVEER